MLNKVAPDVAIHPAICSLLKSDRGGEGMLMVDIDQFEGNSPSVTAVCNTASPSLKTLALLRRQPALNFGHDAN